MGNVTGFEMLRVDWGLIAAPEGVEGVADGAIAGGCAKPTNVREKKRGGQRNKTKCSRKRCTPQKDTEYEP